MAQYGEGYKGMATGFAGCASRLQSYGYPLLAGKQNHVFKPDAGFETVFSLYRFDRELRQLISSEMEKIEIAIH
jgi:abortive infection bacteriophage resistance protein